MVVGPRSVVITHRVMSPATRVAAFDFLNLFLVVCLRLVARY
ncbi:hypothetical protein FTUN_0910 [Frigoriglobus tundricola]|uniref:Uncharacterized protein n=1 Tax=Frigoriglobus tundricola TaxID=2774151 RepID=A0A6M5YIN1_9BACT|nr:hypothetical protein FTUN_0910 [Frigoriglobus tundricola]